ncbi:hypothetical protein VNI00_004601 [Paramarasmius palmivorus]|uniref:Uncharacterized protein n=1 Tax=Paramarasmius palmivorus TaxID=297713 RepID=A0AAW0DI32_9AGAR
MTGGMKKILSGWNDSKRRSKQETNAETFQHYEEHASLTRPVRPPPTPISTPRYSRSRTESSSSPSSPPSSSYLSSTPITPTHEYDQLRDSEDDIWGTHDRSLSYRSTSSESSSSSGQEDGDADEECASLLREWRSSPPSRFQMKRTGRGSRGRARPPPPAPIMTRDIAQDIEVEDRAW